MNGTNNGNYQLLILYHLLGLKRNHIVTSDNNCNDNSHYIVTMIDMQLKITREIAIIEMYSHVPFRLFSGRLGHIRKGVSTTRAAIEGFMRLI